ncbi:MAG: hypothetical protein WC410_02450 [Candidatus Paceibacterota bacterium]|jgi:hypothetical protein|nr:hypothetical protein [Candidatus Paceibacterota bacterium]MDD5555569.1 hypothetical protein [Candidatus Paceibacterota bacterium]
MEVIARVKKGGKDLVALLEKEEMIQAKLTRTGVIVPLDANKAGIYRIPLSIRNKNPFILLHLEESGGSNGSAGFGQIICDVDGGRLRPFRIEKKGIAGFNVANEAAVVCALSKRGNIVGLSIELYKIQRSNNKVVVRRNLLFSGTNPRLPEHLSRFKKAARAAVSKSRCQNCRHLHFVT